MRKIMLSDTNDYFIREDGKSIFYLADTLWTGFSNITMEEWEEYLEYRRSQNFNAFQINVLTQWDGGKPDLNIYPFEIDPSGRFNFEKINKDYFMRAKQMLKTAVEKGFIPVLVVLWGNYVKDTWMSDNNPINIIPFELVKPYVETLVNYFSEFNPMYIISGDTDFRSEIATKYYMEALHTIKRLTPDALVTAHVGGGVHEIPQEFVNPGGLDFYMYQSSHNIESQDMAYKLAEEFSKKPYKKPIVNGEPCYEFSYFGGKYGRYREFDVRKAIWQSLLSGAKAGVTYGAQGVWGWYRKGKVFSNESYGGRGMEWRKALHLEGAWDAGFARWVFENYNLFDIVPSNAVENKTSEIRMSVSKDLNKVVIYVPYNDEIHVSMDLSDYDFTLIDLADKHFGKPIVTVSENKSVIEMHDFNSDVLIIGVK